MSAGVRIRSGINLLKVHRLWLSNQDEKSLLFVNTFSNLRAAHIKIGTHSDNCMDVFLRMLLNM